MSIPFNSLRNRHGILNAELEIPQSFKEETLGVSNQISEILNGNIEDETENLKLEIVDNNSLETNQNQVNS